MSLLVKQDSFVGEISTGNKSYTTVGFEGKAGIFWGTLLTATGFGVNRSLFVSFVSAGAQHSISHYALDAATDGLGTGRRHSTATISGITAAGGTVTPQVVADFVSFDSNGFTLNWLNTGAIIVNYIIIGGSDLTNVWEGVCLTPTVTGLQAYTDPGFQPDCLLTMSIGESNVIPGSYTQARVAFGACTPNGQFALTSHTTDQIPTADATILVTDKALDVENLASTKFAASLDSMNPTGFTYDFSTVQTTQLPFLCLALKGGQYYVGLDTQKTSTGTKSNSSVGFNPKGLMAFGVNRATGTKDLTESKLTIGGSDGTNQGCTWGGSVDKFIRHATGSSVDADGTVTFDPNGYTVDWSVADAIARQFGIIAFGDNPSTITAEAKLRQGLTPLRWR
jgi:hypothetical protein